MVSEIERLNNVIDTLETQSVKAVKFNGVISKIELLKNELTVSSEEIKSLHLKHKKFANEIAEKIENNGNKTFALQNKLAEYQKDQVTIDIMNGHFEKAQQNISSVESKVSDLERVTAEMFKVQMKDMEFKLEQRYMEISTYLKYSNVAITLILLGLLMSFVI